MSQKIALLFPGQGSQAIGMLEELLATSDIVKATFSEASEALGYDLTELVLNGPESELNQTHRT
ncbi:malonyl CoA-acyl carrier protein transacylase, partial [Pseudoalteromonas ruthenica]